MLNKLFPGIIPFSIKPIGMYSLCSEETKGTAIYGTSLNCLHGLNRCGISFSLKASPVGFAELRHSLQLSTLFLTKGNCFNSLGFILTNHKQYRGIFLINSTPIEYGRIHCSASGSFFSNSFFSASSRIKYPLSAALNPFEMHCS